MQYLRQVSDIVIATQESIQCLVLKRITEYEAGESHSTSKESWDCELPNGSILSLQGLDELDSPEIMMQFQSGISELTIPGGTIDRDHIFIPPTAAIRVDNHVDDFLIALRMNYTAENTFDDGPRSRRLMEGFRKVLVVKVIDSEGKSVGHSAHDLRNMLFGAGKNFVNQFKACSFGKLQFGPAKKLNEKNAPTLTAPGIYELRISMRAAGGDQNKIREEVTRKLREVSFLPARYTHVKLDSSYPFQHVFYCLPTGTSKPDPSWIAYGYENGWLSVYNGVWCERMSAHVSFDLALIVCMHKHP